jgi:hypothetical protein
MTEVVVMLSSFVYLLRLKNIIALAPFHQEFELTSFQCQLKNDFIDTRYTSVQYSSFDRAVVMIKKLGFKAQCSKMEVQSDFIISYWDT